MDDVAHSRIGSLETQGIDYWVINEKVTDA
jgi:hypothetical protein